MFVLYDYDSNAILVELMKSRTDAEYLRAYAIVTKHLTDRGLHPQFQMLDNECSVALQQAMTTAGVEFQRRGKSNSHFQKSFHRWPQ